MKKLFVLLLFPLSVFASENEISSFQMSRIYDETFNLNSYRLRDFIDKENKINICVDDYIKKSLRRNSVVAIKNNLYNLLNNINRLESKTQEKNTNISYDEKIQTLATIQCEAYYALGVLK